jgi:hypothetical protein
LAGNVRRPAVFATGIVDPDLGQPIRSPPPQGGRVCMTVLAIMRAR